MKQNKIYFILFGATIALFILGVITLFPNAGASRPNLIGYKSVCTFSPVGTLVLFLITAIVCTIRARVKEKYKMKITPVPLIVLSVLFICGISFYSVQYGMAKTRFFKIIGETAIRRPSVIKASGEFTAKYSSSDIDAEVIVTLKEGRITGIKLVSARNVEEDVANSITGRIINKQTPNVDSVSGATASSLAVMKAVEKALSLQ